LPSVLKIAKVCLKREEQNNMLKFLRERGLIVATASRYNEGGYEILFADNNYSDEDVSITISSYSNVVSFYPTYCKFCGEPLKKSHNRNEMHPNCWKEHIKEYDRARKY
jgi:hypothetical protein